ncbi:MAG: hypothetical protein C5S44_11285 [Candidatus Methanocomedens sp.]|nr:MAG: hypothetical protein C5S44_11285 [ANME-2 cluster archaeon]
MRSSHLRNGCFGIYSECGKVGAFNKCLVWKSRLYFARVPLPINSARPCGMGAGRRFCGALWMHGEQCPELISLILWSVRVVNMRQFELRERFFTRITARCWHPCAVTVAHLHLPKFAFYCKHHTSQQRPSINLKV